MSFTILIPARLGSTRLPNKPLADLGGVPMVVRVAQRVQPDHPAARVVVATDSAAVVAACQKFGVQALLTSAEHASGSDRLAQACTLLQLPDDEIVVNVQGDEPLISPALVGAVADLLLQQPAASMSTAAHPITDPSELANPHVVKVVLDARGLALYFSRAAIPHVRDSAQAALAPGFLAAQPLRHVGIYGYRAGFLRQFPTLAPAPLEQAEALEQLRALWHGYRIAVHVSPQAIGPGGVDTPEDLARVRQFFLA